jgi:hypothetical protein
VSGMNSNFGSGTEGARKSELAAILQVAVHISTGVAMLSRKYR